ncbi:MAG: PAS domain S-box protein [Paracoccaceae bacterium]|nr:MAG: PAS domain S-box protein [Paracoccaceae bacterium]
MTVDMIAVDPPTAEGGTHGPERTVRRHVTLHQKQDGSVFFADVVSRRIGAASDSAWLTSIRDVTRFLDVGGDDTADADDEEMPSPDDPPGTGQGAAGPDFDPGNEVPQAFSEELLTRSAAPALLKLAFWSVDLDLMEVSIAPALHDIAGIDPSIADMPLEDWWQIIHPEDRDRTRIAFMSFPDSGQDVFRAAYRIVRPDDGSTIHVAAVGELGRNGAGRLCLQGMLQDMTASVTSRRELESASHLLQIAGKAARLGGWRIHLDTGRLTWTTETAAIHGLPPGTDMTLERALSFFPEEHRDTMAGLFDAAIQRGEAFDVVLQIVTVQGRRLWVRSVGAPLFDSTGAVIAIQGAFQDIDELVQARTKLAEVSDRLAVTLEHISDAFFMLDRNWRFTYLNERAETFLQRSRNDLIGRRIWDEFPDAIGTQSQSVYERVLIARETVRFTQHYAPLGAWFEAVGYPVPEGIAVYFRDVTQERAQQERMHLLENAVSRMNDIVLITAADPIDAPDGPPIVFVNEAFERITGYASAEVMGRTPRLLQGPDTSRVERERIRQALRERRPVRTELVNYTKAGMPYWIEVEIVPLSDGLGKVTHFVAIERDITERKRLDEELRISTERFLLISKATSDAIYDWDFEAGQVWRNEGMASLIGRDPTAIPPGPEGWAPCIHETDRERVLESLYEAIDGPDTTWTLAYRVRTLDGEIRDVIDRGFIIRNSDGRAVRMVGSMIDVTEQKEMEARLRQSQKLEAVGQLTGGVAHDFNNLLTVILGNAEILTEGLSSNNRMRLMAEMTATAAQRGAELTARLLAFARRQTLEPKVVNLNRLVSGMEALIRRTLPEEIDIEIVHSGSPWLVEIDPGQLEVALLNLVINARDAMPRGGRLTVETANVRLDDAYSEANGEVPPGQYVQVAVTDSGTGMAPDVVARAFDPFFTTKDVGKGSGLGLSMVYGFAKQSGGHVRIYSEQGFGTTVKLYFPRSLEVGDEVAGVGIEERSVGGHEHILVAEDDRLVREHVVMQLQGLGYRVTAAANGPDALECIRQMADIDLLFADVIMPGGITGRELADEATQLRPGLKVLFTSGYTENSIVHNGRLDPGIQLLQKPYRRRDLAAKLRRMFAQSTPGKP